MSINDGNSVNERPDAQHIYDLAMEIQRLTDEISEASGALLHRFGTPQHAADGDIVVGKESICDSISDALIDVDAAAESLYDLAEAVEELAAAGGEI